MGIWYSEEVKHAYISFPRDHRLLRDEDEGMTHICNVPVLVSLIINAVENEEMGTFELLLPGLDENRRAQLAEGCRPTSASIKWLWV
jgi:hypothetical protein